MGRSPLHSEQTVRDTVRTMLAENCHGAPVSPALFRRVVSARKLQTRLGGGDLATYARILKAVETEVTRDTAVRNAIPDLPENVANLMRAVWRAALETQGDAIRHIQQETADAVAIAETSREEASSRVELLYTQLEDLRKELAERAETIGGLRAKLEESVRKLAGASSENERLSAELTATKEALEAAGCDHRARLEQVTAEYDGLHRRLQEETDAQRQAWVEARKALHAQLDDVKERLTEVRAERQRLHNELVDRRASN